MADQIEPIIAAIPKEVFDEASALQRLAEDVSGASFKLPERPDNRTETVLEMMIQQREGG